MKGQTAPIDLMRTTPVAPARWGGVGVKRTTRQSLEVTREGRGRERFWHNDARNGKRSKNKNKETETKHRSRASAAPNAVPRLFHLPAPGLEDERAWKRDSRPLDLESAVIAQGAEEFSYSLALLCKPYKIIIIIYILTYMKHARIQERYRRTITSHRRRANTHQLPRACDVVVLRYPSCKSTYSELVRKLLHVRSACTTYTRESERLNSSAPCGYCTKWRFQDQFS